MADLIGGASEHYTIRDSLHCIDPDCLLEEELTDFVEEFSQEGSTAAIADFLSAIAALVADDIANDQMD